VDLLFNSYSELNTGLDAAMARAEKGLLNNGNYYIHPITGIQMNRVPAGQMSPWGKTLQEDVYASQLFAIPEQYSNITSVYISINSLSIPIAVNGAQAGDVSSMNLALLRAYTVDGVITTDIVIEQTVEVVTDANNINHLGYWIYTSHYPLLAGNYYIMARAYNMTKGHTIVLRHNVDTVLATVSLKGIVE